MQSHQKHGGELDKWVSLCLCCLKCSMCVTSQCKRSPWAGAREESPPPQAGAPTAGVGEEQVEAGESRTGGPRPGRWSALCPSPWKTDEYLLCTRQTLLWVSAQMIRGVRQGSPHFIDLGLQTVEMTENVAAAQLKESLDQMPAGGHRVGAVLRTQPWRQCWRRFQQLSPLRRSFSPTGYAPRAQLWTGRAAGDPTFSFPLDRPLLAGPAWPGSASGELGSRSRWSGGRI